MSGYVDVLQGHNYDRLPRELSRNENNKLTRGQKAVLSFIYNQTVGYQQYSDNISYSQFVKNCSVSNNSIKEIIEFLELNGLVSIKRGKIKGPTTDINQFTITEKEHHALLAFYKGSVEVKDIEHNEEIEESEIVDLEEELIELNTLSPLERFQMKLTKEELRKAISF